MREFVVHCVEYRDRACSFESGIWNRAGQSGLLHSLCKFCVGVFSGLADRGPVGGSRDSSGGPH
jgi:hypothetical protein